MPCPAAGERDRFGRAEAVAPCDCACYCCCRCCSRGQRAGSALPPTRLVVLQLGPTARRWTASLVRRSVADWDHRQAEGGNWKRPVVGTFKPSAFCRPSLSVISSAESDNVENCRRSHGCRLGLLQPAMSQVNAAHSCMRVQSTRWQSDRFRGCTSSCAFSNGEPSDAGGLNSQLTLAVITTQRSGTC